MKFIILHTSSMGKILSGDDWLCNIATISAVKKPSDNRFVTSVQIKKSKPSHCNKM